MSNINLDFNSVENLPNLNARSAFQVDSSAVIREQGDIVPTIIDDHTAYMPWSRDNQMPFDILNLIESDETLSSCQIFNPKCAMVRDWCINPKPKSAQHKQQIEDFFLYNDMASYFLACHKTSNTSGLLCR